MIEKNLFYQCSKLFVLNQVHIKLLNNFKITNNFSITAELLKDTKINTLVNLFDKPLLNNQIFSFSNINENSVVKGRHFNNWTSIPYWWETQIQVSSSQDGLKYGQWASFFTNFKENASEFNVIQHDLYLQNFANNQTLVSKQYFNSQLKSDFYQLPNEMLTTFNKQFLWSFLQTTKSNWNSLQLIESDKILSNLLFESFNKAFNILEQNRDY